MKLLCCIIVTWNLCSIYTKGEITRHHPDNGINPHDIRVWLFTSTKTSIPQFDLAVNEADVLTNKIYNSSNSLSVFIHGFQGTSNETKYLRIKDGYLEKGGWNVILLDWAPLSNVDSYGDAVRDADIVASLFAQFLNTLISKSLVDVGKIHLIGFSIGSHIAGMVGKRVNGKVARINALDPAYPMYEAESSTKRLHVDDAEFVMVIHTSGKFLAFEQHLGHADFYPNGGKFPQPSCLNINQGGDLFNMISMMTCSHALAVQYFTDSIFNESQFMAKKCKSWNDYLSDKCSGEEIPMGYATPNSARGDYYTKIN